MTSGKRSVHQLLPSFSTGDAIGNYARTLRALFRKEGYESEIFAELGDREGRADSFRLSALKKRADAQTVTLLHHSIEGRYVPLFSKLPGKKAVMYHNVTPAHFFRAVEPVISDACDAGRRELRELAPVTDRAFYYSRFNGEELGTAGFKAIERFPFLVDWSHFDAAPDPRLAASLQDGRTNVLFVGRMDAPNKRADDLIRAFAAYQRLYDPESRLVLAGGFNPNSAYGQSLKGLSFALGLRRVHFLGRMTQSELSAAFAHASVYASMSDHEGLGVPLLEAMHRQIPVVAYGASAVPETMDGAGIVLNAKDPLGFAQVLSAVVSDAGLRERVIAAQHARIARFADPAEQRVVTDAVARLFEDDGRGARPAFEAASRVIVCPSFESHPEGAFAKAARRAASAGASLWTLAAKERSTDAWPARRSAGAVPYLAFSAEWPAHGDVAPRGSSSMETAVASAKEISTLVFFGERDELSERLSTILGGRFSFASADATETEKVAHAS